jgi:chromosomal replication initiation ATPase DnaA
MEHTITRLVREAARLADVPYEMVISSCKKRVCVRARWAVMLVAYDLKYSSVDVGQRIGGFDHSTVLNALRRGKELLDKGDKEFAELVRGLARMVSREEGKRNGN